MENQITSKELAEILGITRRRIQQLTKEGALSSVKIGKAHHYDSQKAIEEYQNYTENENKNLKAMQAKQDAARALIGSKIGCLKVDAIAGKTSDGETLMRCSCDCGNVRTVRLFALKRCKYKRCGSMCTLHRSDRELQKLANHKAIPRNTDERCGIGKA